MNLNQRPFPKGWKVERLRDELTILRGDGEIGIGPKEYRRSEV